MSITTDWGTIGLSCFNLDEECLGSDGIVHWDLMNPNPRDHHYHKGHYVRLTVLF
ncbi:MAG: hypothetical protein GX230_03380 [Lentisphaerae bacterium]|nr:hypothetical protein [Lentisphaerota bacterium]